MSAGTAVRLARSGVAADRARFWLVAGSVAFAGAFVLAAAQILGMSIGDAFYAADAGLARFVTEPGLRPGTAAGALLLAVPVLALTAQALRLGSVARDRRVASLRLAGATPRQVRAVAAAECGLAAGAGGLLAGPAGLVVYLLAGVLPPAGARLLDGPDAQDLLVWAALIPLAAAAGACAGAVVEGRAVAEPLGVRRRQEPVAPGAASAAALALGLAAVVAGVASGAGGIVAAIAGLLVAAFAGGPRLVLAVAGALARRPGVEALLASRRLRADPRSAGRVAGVLLTCGIALGIDVLLLVGQGSGDGFSGDADFYLAGYGLTAIAVAVAALVALVTLLVGAVDGLLDARRPLATLAASGVDERLLGRALTRQLTAIAVPALVAGALAGGPLLALLTGIGDTYGTLWVVVLAGLGAALAGGMATAAAARLVARLLRPQIRAAIDPENLRAA